MSIIRVVFWNTRISVFDYHSVVHKKLQGCEKFEILKVLGPWNETGL